MNNNMDTWCLEQISTGGAYFFYTYKVFTIHKSHQICSEKILQILNAIDIMELKFFLFDLWCCVDVSNYFKNSFSTIFNKRFFYPCWTVFTDDFTNQRSMWWKRQLRDKMFTFFTSLRVFFTFFQEKSARRKGICGNFTKNFRWRPARIIIFWVFFRKRI